jgi:hypothetical protein
MDNQPDTSHKIKALLALKGLTMDTLAPLLNVHPMTVYNRMKANSWSVDDLNKIAGYHNIDPKELI